MNRVCKSDSFSLLRLVSKKLLTSTSMGLSPLSFAPTSPSPPLFFHPPQFLLCPCWASQSSTCIQWALALPAHQLCSQGTEPWCHAHRRTEGYPAHVELVWRHVTVLQLIFCTFDFPVRGQFKLLTRLAGIPVYHLKMRNRVGGEKEDTDGLVENCCFTTNQLYRYFSTLKFFFLLLSPL